MNGMRPRERTPPRAHCGLPASGCSCCFFCRESSLSRLSLAIPSLTSGASPMSPLRQTLFRPAIHPPRRVLPFLVFAILCHTACFCLLPLDLGHFLEGHHFYPSVVLAVLLQVWSLDHVYWHPLYSWHAGSWAPPAPTESEPLGMASRCSLCIPKCEKHQLMTRSSPYWRGEWRKGKRKGIARRERGRRVDLVARVLLPYFSLH